MSRLLPALSIALGLTTAGCLVYAWQLHGRLMQSEASVAAKAAELARLRAELPALDQRGPLVEDTAADGAPTPPAATPGDPRGGNPVGTVGVEARNDAGRARRTSPEAQRLMALQRRAGLDNRYAALFRNLKLSPADLEKFKDLLVDRQSAAMDVFNTAREEGMNPRENREQIRQLIESFEAETDLAIRETLGETAYQQYQQYEQSFPQRAVVNQVEQRLSYSSTPFYGNQAEQLVSLLASAAAARRATPGSSSDGNGGRQLQITDAVIAQSEGFLSPPQVAALRQLQQEQLAQAGLRQQMQQTRRDGRPGPPPAPGTGP